MRPTRRLTLFLARLATMVGVAVAATGGSASATDTDADPVSGETTQVVQGEDLEDAETAGSRRAENEFLSENADRGFLYDSAEVDNGTVRGVTAVWSTTADLDQVVIDREQAVEATEPGSIAGIGAAVDNTEGPADESLVQMGSSKLSYRYGYLRGDGGTVQITVSGFKLVSGWERLQLREDKTDRDSFYYGHWATAYGKSTTGYDPAPYVVDVRSRPKVGYRGTFKQVRDYWPKRSSNSCNSAGEIGIGFGIFRGTLPLQNCSSLSPSPDLGNIAMKVVWSAGQCKDSTVEGADLGMVVDVARGVKAILSDYSYARFNSGGPYGSSACNLSTGDDVRAIYADPGWS